MAKTALEEWKALNRAVNCKHYIGARRWAVIDDAVYAYGNTVAPASDSKPVLEKPSPSIKTPEKAPVAAPAKAKAPTKSPIKKAD